MSKSSCLLGLYKEKDKQMKWLDRLFMVLRSLLVLHSIHQQTRRIRCPEVGFLALGFGIFLAACVSHSVVSIQSGNFDKMLPGFLYRPKGTGPYPAMVLLHTCAGLRPHVFDWASWLTAQGYVALAVESYSDGCEGGGLTADGFAWDAIGALAYLRSLPFVDRERIGVMGWSAGGGAALAATSKMGPENWKSLEPYSGPRFRVAVAFYPNCQELPPDPVIPILLLVGEADDWTGYYRCVEVSKELQQQGRTVLWKVYPGVHHGFDQNFPNREVLGHTLEYSGWATADSEKRVRAFLAQYLRGAKSGAPAR